MCSWGCESAFGSFAARLSAPLRSLHSAIVCTNSMLSTQRWSPALSTPSLLIWPGKHHCCAPPNKLPVIMNITCLNSHHFRINTPRKQGGLGPMKIPLLSDLTHQISKDYGVYLEDQGHTLRCDFPSTQVAFFFPEAIKQKNTFYRSNPWKSCRRGLEKELLSAFI